MLKAVSLGWPKKNKNVKTENVPLSCEYVDQVEKKRLHSFGKYPAQARSRPFKIADPPS